MNKEYLQSLYQWITSNDMTYANDVSMDAFLQKMQSEEYANKMYGWITSIDPSYANDVPYDSYLNKIGYSGISQPQAGTPNQQDPLKKKDATVSGSQSGSSVASLASQSTTPSDPFKGTILADNLGVGNFERNITGVNANLIDYEEEYVVPKMNYEFGQYGFTFEQTGIGSDGMNVKAANGKTLYVNLDPWWGEADEAKKLKKFLEENKQNVSSLNRNAEVRYQEEVKVKNENEIRAAVKKMDEEAKAWERQVVQALALKESQERIYNEKFKNVSIAKINANPQLKAEYDSWNEGNLTQQEHIKALAKQEEYLKSKGQKLDRLVGQYSDMKSEQGTWAGGIWNALLNGAASMSSGVANVGIDIMTWGFDKAGMLMSESKYRNEIYRIAEEKGFKVPENAANMSNDEILEAMGDKGDVIHSKILDLSRKSLKYFDSYDEAVEGKYRNPFSGAGARYDDSGMLDAIRKGNVTVFGTDNTTTEWADLKKEGFWGGSILGLAESIPAMIGGAGFAGWAQRSAQMYAQVTDHVNKEMANNPDFDNISEAEKEAVMIPIGVAVGTLEALGFRNVIGQRGLLNNLVLRALGKTTVNTTAKSFGQFIRNDVENMMARGLLTMTAAGLAEFETGFSQEIAEAGIKDIYNTIKSQEEENKGKKFFKTPDTWTEYLSDALYAGAQEAVGGFIMGVPAAISNAVTKGDMPSVPNEVFQMFEEMKNDANYISFFETKLQNQIDLGEITQEEANKQKETFTKVVGLSEQIPTDLSEEGRKEALGLLYQKQELENKIKITDPILAKRDVAKLNDVNNRLEAILNEKIEADQALDPEAEKKRITDEFTDNELYVITEEYGDNWSEAGTARAKLLVDPIAYAQEKIAGGAIGNAYTDFISALENVSSKTQQEATSPIVLDVEGLGEVTSTTTEQQVSPDEQLDIESFFSDEPNPTKEKLSNNLSLNKNQQENVKVENPFRNIVINSAKLGAKSIAKVLPNTRIVLHESNDEYLRNVGRDGRAEYIPSQDVIHINLEGSDKGKGANAITVPHEIFHAVFINKLKTDSAAAAKAQEMMFSVRKSLANDSALAKRIDDFAAMYTGDQVEFQNEERIAELIGIMSSEYRTLSRPQKNIIIQYLQAFARKFGIELDKDFDSNDQKVIDLLNTLSKKVRKGKEITEKDIDLLNSEPYDGGVSVSINPDGTSTPQPRQTKLWQGVDFVTELPVITLSEFSDRVNGQLFAVTSDVTKVGYDSMNERIDGGPGYMSIESNATQDVGFASKDLGTSAQTLGKIANQYQEGSKVGVVIMTQNPSSTIGNFYGAKYLGRGLKAIQQSNPSLYNEVFNSIADLLNNNVKIREELDKNKTSAKLLELFRDPSKYTEQQFAEEYIKDTSFEVRRPLADAMLINSEETRTNKSTPIYKTALKDAGFTVQNFLSEYGDVELIGENNMKQDKGGFLVGGFEMIVPSKESIPALIEELKNKGLTHPQFNGKLPSDGQSFMFDGLYPIQENLVEFAESQTEIKSEMKEEANKRVRELAQEKGDVIYDKKFTDEKSPKYMAPENRGYTQMTAQSKIFFKSSNQDLLQEKTPQLAPMVAQGKGVKMKQEGVPKGQQFTTTPRQQKTIQGVAQAYNMNVQGFFPKQVNVVALRNAVRDLGYDIKQARVDEYGRGGSYYLVNSYGRKVNPFDNRARQQRSMNQIIQEGRDNNFRDAVIRDYLIRVKGFPARRVDSAMEVGVDLFSIMPESFKNINGGVQAGSKLFERVNNFRKKLIQKNERNSRLTPAELEAKIKEYAETQRSNYDTISQIDEKVKAKRDALNEKNRRARNPKTRAEINAEVKAYRESLMAKRDANREQAKQNVDKFRRNETNKNNRKAPLLSEQEIVDKTIEFLEAQPEYQAEADMYTVQGEQRQRKGLSTIQAKMLSDMQKYVGIRPTQNMAQKIRKARLMLQQRAKGARDLQSIKSELRNFIRKTLPPELYTKKEVVDMVRKIELANQDNIDNLYNEVLELATKKNVEALTRSIDNILNGKYTQDVSGRKKAKKVDLYTKERIESIKKMLVSEDATAEDIATANAALMDIYNDLDINPEQTSEMRDQMVDIEVAMALNNSRVMDDTDIHKASELDLVNNTLSQMIEFGVSSLKAQLEEAHNEYVRQFEYIYEDITGETIDMSQEDAQEKLEKSQRERGTEAQRDRVKGRIRKALSGIGESITKVFTSTEALDGLMDKISSLPGEMFGGRTQELVTDKIDESSRKFKTRRMLTEAVVHSKLEDIFGPKWKSIVREHRKIKATGIYQDIDAYNRAVEAYEANPNKDTKKALEKEIKKNELILSQDQMYYLYNQYKDPANKKSFEKTFGPQYERVMQELTDKLDPNVKQFADWQVNEFFPELYEHYNDVYKKIYRTNLPWNRFYAGRLYRDGVVEEPLDLLADQSVYNTSVGAASTKNRIQNNHAIKKMNGTDALFSYLNDMEYFAAYAESIRDINKLFTNKYIKSAITDIHGKATMSLITDSIQKIANKGTRNDLANSFVNSMNNIFIVSRLAFSPVIMLKQLTSMFTYANDIGYGNWIKYSAKNITELRKVYKEVRDNSVYMQDRKYDSIMKVLESYTDESMKEFVPTPAKDWAVNAMMYFTKLGDAGAIYLGGMANYSYYKAQAMKQGKSEQEAIDIAVRKFEKDTKRTQQSSDLQDKDVFQTGHPVVRALNMFLTSPKQYLRKEIQSIRNLNRKLMAWDRNAGKGSVRENLRTFVMYHVFMPVLFQWVAGGMPGLFRAWREDDDEDLLRAGIIGNLNSLFIVGEVFNVLGDYFTDKPWAGESFKSVGILTIAGELAKKAKKASNYKDEEKRDKAWADFRDELMTITGLPAPTIRRFVDNYSKVGTGGDIGEDILRLLNYSEYQISGAPGKGSSEEEKSFNDYLKGSSKKSSKSSDDEEQSFNDYLEKSSGSVKSEGKNNKSDADAFEQWMYYQQWDQNN